MIEVTQRKHFMEISIKMRDAVWKVSQHRDNSHSGANPDR